MTICRAHNPAPAAVPHLPRRSRGVVLAGLLALLALAGCGSPGSPQPPSLKLPVPPADLSAARTGDQVSLRWTMPRRATDRLLLKGDQQAVICRSLPPAPCSRVGDILLLPGTAASYTDTLGPALGSGPPRLLAYTILLQNRSGRGAGPSNLAYTAAGDAPPEPVGVVAKTQARGIVLAWQQANVLEKPVGAVRFEHLLRLERTRLLAPGEGPKPGTAEEQAGVPQPLEQTLSVVEPEPAAPAETLLEGWLLHEAVDRDAALNRTYRYTVAEVARLTLGGQAIEVSGKASAPVTVVARDLFAPAAPRGLEAVADAEGGAIDLSWTPDSEADLAGYFVYREVAGSATRPEQVSGAAPVVDSAWRDVRAAAGVRYAYSVSAVDTSGNESARSAQAEESVIPVAPGQKPTPRAESAPSAGPSPSPSPGASPGPSPGASPSPSPGPSPETTPQAPPHR